MTKARWIILAAALSAVVAVSGCSEQSAGSPMPDETVPTDSEPDTTESTTGTEPSSERPREIRLDGKDPCGLIPPSDWPGLTIEGPGQPMEDPNFDSPQCYYRSVGNLTLVVTQGLEEWTDAIASAEITKAEPIEGFPTLTIWNEVDERSCYGAVDVADGQFLTTTAAPIVADPQKSESCDVAYRLAVSAMKTLVAS